VLDVGRDSQGRWRDWECMAADWTPPQGCPLEQGTQCGRIDTVRLLVSTHQRRRNDVDPRYPESPYWLVRDYRFIGCAIARYAVGGQGLPATPEQDGAGGCNYATPAAAEESVRRYQRDQYRFPALCATASGRLPELPCLASLEWVCTRR
jgi:hypothetical protein